MSIKLRRYGFLACVFLALAWNLLCLGRVLPLGEWPVSLAFAGLGSLMGLFPLVFRLPVPPEASKHLAALDTGERALAGLTIALAAAWAVTVLACLVYPL